MKTIQLFSFIVALLVLGFGCKEEAIMECGIQISECTINCEKEPHVGPCNAAMPRYYFDKIEGKCKEFIWGGCSGVVPFETLEACEACDCTN